MSVTNYGFQNIKQIDVKALYRAFAAEVSSNSMLRKFSNNALLRSQRIAVIQDMSQQFSSSFDHNYYNISTSELLELSKSDIFEIDAHTMNHTILADENDEFSNYEINESIKSLEKLIVEPIRSFAYPNGLSVVDYSDKEIKTLKKSIVFIILSCRYARMKVSDNIY